jgi:alpha/beta superfamily hydrolase
MYIVKIGNKWINLDVLERARQMDMEDANHLTVIFANSTDHFFGNEAKALAQLLDNMSTKVKVEGD